MLLLLLLLAGRVRCLFNMSTPAGWARRAREGCTNTAEGTPAGLAHPKDGGGHGSALSEQTVPRLQLLQFLPLQFLPLKFLPLQFLPLKILPLQFLPLQFLPLLFTYSWFIFHLNAALIHQHINTLIRP
jgi:hypothetical protein